MPNPFDSKVRKVLNINNKEYHYYSLKALRDSRVEKLPYCIRVLLESALRNCDGCSVPEKTVESILDWVKNSQLDTEVAFKPARVILQDFTGVPAIVDLAAMRDATKNLGSDPESINPHVPVDLVIDHSVQVDKFRTAEALEQNLSMEMHRNRERFIFLKWGAKAFKGLTIVPPGAGIVHQVNLEYLARVVFNNEGLLYPDSLVGTDSHTPMVNGLGVVGWGVGGIEAEAVMLGQPISLVLPEVIGFRVSGELSPQVTSTDLVLSITNMLRKVGVVDKFVEFYGPGLSNLSIADRATISNMSPEMGCTISFFAVDDVALEYMRLTGRDEEHVRWVERYCQEQGLFRDYKNESCVPTYSQCIELDLSEIIPAISGPKRPHDYVPLKDSKRDFLQALKSPIGFKGYAIEEANVRRSLVFEYEGSQYRLCHGSIVIAAITSCTNTSNPSVMIGAGLLAKRAVEAGLSVRPYIKTSLAPGSGVVTLYLEKSGLLPYLEKLGFNVVGYGCTTCIGNSGPLPDEVGRAVEEGDLVVAGVLSGNRNFEGRIHPLVRANYLASPPLVVAYALAGRLDIDFESEPLGVNLRGERVFLRDIFPTHHEVSAVVSKNVLREMFTESYSKVTKGTSTWNELLSSDSKLYDWDESSTYIHNPPFFSTMTKECAYVSSISGARVLLHLGDSITTDHISPAGSISKTSPAARYLTSKGVSSVDFNSYGARRGNDQVMARGTFANIRLVNKFLPHPGPKTLYLPTNEVLDIFDVSQKYLHDNVPLLILAGEQYGSGSSRDWAAKGVWMLGVKVVIAQSYERIHRSNLTLFGLIPLQFKSGQSASTLGLSGKEIYSIDLGSDIKVNQDVTVKVEGGSICSFTAILRFDTETEINYFKHGGVLNYVIRQTVNS